MAGNPNERKHLPRFTGRKTEAMQPDHIVPWMNLQVNPKQHPRETSPNDSASNEDRKDISRSLASPSTNPNEADYVRHDPSHSKPSEAPLLPGSLSPSVDPKGVPTLILTTSSSPGLSLPPHKPLESDPLGPPSFPLSPKDLQPPQLDDTGPEFRMPTDDVCLKEKRKQPEASAAQTTASASAEESTPNSSADPHALGNSSPVANDLSQAEATGRNRTYTPERHQCNYLSSTCNRLQAKGEVNSSRLSTNQSSTIQVKAKNDTSTLYSVNELPNMTSSGRYIFQSEDSDKFMADENHENNALKTDQNDLKTTIGGSLLDRHNSGGKNTCNGSQSGRADKNGDVRTETKHNKLAAASPTNREGSHEEEREQKSHPNPSATVSDAAAVTAGLGRRSAIPTDGSSNLCPAKFPNDLVPPETVVESLQSPRESCVEKSDEVDYTKTTVLPDMKTGQEAASAGDVVALATASSSAIAAEDSETSASSPTSSISSTSKSPLSSDKRPAVCPNSQPNAGCHKDPEASNQNDVSLTGPRGGREHLSTYARSTTPESSSPGTPLENVTVPSVSGSELKRPVMVTEYSGNDSLPVGNSDQIAQGSASSSPSPSVQLQLPQTSCAGEGPSGERAHRLSRGQHQSPEPEGCVRRKLRSSGSRWSVAAVPPLDARDPGMPDDQPSREARPPSTLTEDPDSVTPSAFSVREGKQLLKKLEEEHAALKEKRTCKICCTADWEYVPSVCRHLICLQCHFRLDGLCPFCRERNSYVRRGLRDDECGLDLFTPAGDRASTFVLPSPRTADDQVLAELPPDLRMSTPRTREDFDSPVTRVASRTQLLDLSRKMGRGKMPAFVRMGTLECRHASFTVFQPQTPCPKQMAEAGLFGDQRQDHPQCFHCAGHVVVEGDPVTCHAKQFPSCDYLYRLLPVPKNPEFRWRRLSM